MIPVSEHIDFTLREHECVPSPELDQDPDLLKWWEEEGQYSNYIRLVMLDLKNQTHKAIQSPIFRRDGSRDQTRSQSIQQCFDLMGQEFVHRNTEQAPT